MPPPSAQPELRILWTTSGWDAPKHIDGTNKATMNGMVRINDWPNIYPPWQVAVKEVRGLGKFSSSSMFLDVRPQASWDLYPTVEPVPPASSAVLVSGQHQTECLAPSTWAESSLKPSAPLPPSIVLDSVCRREVPIISSVSWCSVPSSLRQVSFIRTPSACVANCTSTVFVLSNMSTRWLLCDYWTGTRKPCTCRDPGLGVYPPVWMWPSSEPLCFESVVGRFCYGLCTTVLRLLRGARTPWTGPKTFWVCFEPQIRPYLSLPQLAPRTWVLGMTITQWARFGGLYVWTLFSSPHWHYAWYWQWGQWREAEELEVLWK